MRFDRNFTKPRGMRCCQSGIQNKCNGKPADVYNIHTGKEMRSRSKMDIKNINEKKESWRHGGE